MRKILASLVLALSASTAATTLADTQQILLQDSPAIAKAFETMLVSSPHRNSSVSNCDAVASRCQPPFLLLLTKGIYSVRN